ncbi:hypothetical protein G3M48_007294 [Beauveria asiatica]|uniref:Uncharacterized protein n=1 Tax=Beauveria asiatica TaxID=1069075 RepID=A0AAW0RMY0_9HYPO
MRLTILSLVPLFSAASTIGDRDVTLMNNDPETVDVKDIPETAKLGVLGLRSSSQPKDGITPAARCPAGYPVYCEDYGTCCPSGTGKCCEKYCCYSRNAVCGADGYCYT